MKEYRLVLIDEAGNPAVLGDAEGDVTTAHLLRIFSEAINLQRKKALTYGEAFRSQGYMGNVARVLSKAARLRRMLWLDFPIEDAEEPVQDTLLDLINLAGFLIINYRDRNRWGH